MGWLCRNNLVYSRDGLRDITVGGAGIECADHIVSRDVGGCLARGLDRLSDNLGGILLGLGAECRGNLHGVNTNDN